MYLRLFGPETADQPYIYPHAMCPTSTWFFFLYIYFFRCIYLFILSVLVLTVLNLPNGIVQLAPVANAA